MLTVKEIREICDGEQEVEAMTDDDVERLQATCYRLAYLLLEAVGEDNAI